MAFYPTLDRIHRQARQVKFSRVLMTLLVFPPYAVGWGLAKGVLAVGYGLGWTAAKVMFVIGIVLAHAGVAFSAGWKDALGGPGR